MRKDEAKYHSFLKSKKKAITYCQRTLICMGAINLRERWIMFIFTSACLFTYLFKQNKGKKSSAQNYKES